MKIVGIIPARYASTRFPGKPLVMIGGATMIHRVYEQAQQSRLDAVVVATDDVRIAEEVKAFGGRYVLTDTNHRSGTDRCREAFDLLDEPFDAVVNIQGDEPFIDPEQIDLLVRQISCDGVVLATLAKRIENEEELFSSNTVKVVVDAFQNALYFSRNPIPFLRNVDRDKWVSKGFFYKHVGIYAYRSDTLRKVAGMPLSNLEKAESLEQLRWLENGLAIRVAETESDTLSIDTPDDLARAELFLSARNEKKKQ